MAEDEHDVSQGSPERFGYSWSYFNELTPEQEEQFRRWTCHLDPAKDWIGKRFLDAGCGMGRNSYWAMSYGAASGLAIAVDDRSLTAARHNLRSYPGVEVQFRSVYDLDIEDTFDIAFSIGVIHHLEHPELALVKMRDAVKPGGRVLIWVYGRENMELYVKVLNPLRKVFFSRMPMALVRVLAYAPAGLLWLYLRLGLGGIEYLNLLRGFPFRHLHAVVFDQMLPRIANYWRRDEVLALMEGAALDDIRIEWVNQMSWSAIGTKRSASPPSAHA